MRLISLKLKNFRQHADSEIHFQNGVTAVVGDNGTGKSTLLEAISWAIYGTDAVRNTKDTIIWNKAAKYANNSGEKAKVRVELTFSLDNETYRVVRELGKAELYHGSSPTPTAISQGEVTKKLISILGMIRQEFFNTYFTGQKELNFLANMQPAEKKIFINKILDYEKIRTARDKVRVDKNNLDREMAAMKQGLEDIDSLKEEKKLYKEKITAIDDVLKNKRREQDFYAAEMGKLQPKWNELKTQKEEFTKLSTELNFTNDKIADLKRNLEILKKEQEEIEIKSKRFEEIKPLVQKYKETEKRILEQETLQKNEIRRQKYLSDEQNIINEIQKIEANIKQIENKITEQKETQNKAEALKTEIQNLKEEIESALHKWTSQKQETATLIRQKEIEFEKTAKSLSLIIEKGEEGECPTCRRSLKGEFKQVTDDFKKQIDDVNLEIKELSENEKQLKEEPRELSSMKNKYAEREKTLADLNKALTLFEEAQRNFSSLNKELESKKVALLQIKKSLNEIPEGYDERTLVSLKEEFANLKKLYEEAISLKVSLENKDKINKNLEDAQNSLKILLTKTTECEERLKTFSYSEEEYLKAENEIIEKQNLYLSLQKEVLQTEGDLKEASAVMDRIIKSENQFKEKMAVLKDKQTQLSQLFELERFYGLFLDRLNEQIRPEISDLASDYLSKLTDGRYNILELNEKYDICLREDESADIKAVISGGEEDIANLCIRLAISKLIAQRSGRTLSLLILDEVFGSLDENRRNNVVELLSNLSHDFEQIILITHIDEIKESSQVDNIIKLEFDAEKECSIVTNGTIHEQSLDEPELSVL